MLVLGRRVEESIIIGEGDTLVEVKVLDLRRDTVRLGITASKSISIHRKEIYEEIQREKGK